MADPAALIKTTELAYEEARKARAEIAALKDQFQTVKIIVRDLAYISKELVEHDPEAADETYGAALEGHLAALDTSLGEGDV